MADMDAYEAGRRGHREPVDQTALEELDIYINNTSELYPQKKAILLNVQRRVENGSYDPTKAPKLWLYWVDNGAKLYASEFASSEREWSQIFSPATREALARRIAHREYEELMLQRELRPGQTERIRAVFSEPAGREHGSPWPRSAHEDAGPEGALDWKQQDGAWVAKTFGNAKYKLVPENDGFHAYYVHDGHERDLGFHGNLGAAMGAARRHQPRMSKAAEGSDELETKASSNETPEASTPFPVDTILRHRRSGKLYRVASAPYEAANGREYQNVVGQRDGSDFGPSRTVEVGSNEYVRHEMGAEEATRKLTDAEVVELPVGSVVFMADSVGSQPLVVIPDGKLTPVSMLPERARRQDDPKPDGDHVSAFGQSFVLVREGHGEIPTHKTAQQAAISWLEARDRRRGREASEDDQIYTHKGIGYELQKRFQGGRPGWVYVVHFDKGRRTSHIHYDTKAEARSAAKSVIDDGWASGEVREAGGKKIKYVKNDVNGWVEMPVNYDPHQIRRDDVVNDSQLRLLDYTEAEKRGLYEGGAGERVPVIHEQKPEIVGASVTTTETATVVTAQEDFSTVSQAEQHAYTVGARFIAPFGKRKYYVFTPRKSGGYDKRLMFHKAGKWHISADKVIAQRLSRDSRAIRVSQTAKTIVREEAGHGEILDVDALAHRAKAAHDGSIMWVEFLPGDQGKDWGYTRDSKKAVPLSPHWQRRFKRYMESVNDGAVFIPAFKGSNEGVRASAREMSDKDRSRKVVGYVGDVSWIEYGGGPIYRTKDGYVLEYLEPSDEEGGQTTIYRVDLDPSVPTWGDIDAVADSSGQDVEDLRKAFTSEDPFDRAYAYQAWAGHYGWHEFDNYPLTLSPSEINKRYFGTMQALKKLKRPHGYRWSASEARRSRRGVREARGRERLVVRLMNEAEARSLRNRLDATTKGYSDRMGSSVWTDASRDEIEAALSHLGYAGTATIEKDTGGKADERRRGRAREQTHTFKKGDEVRWSDAMLAKGKDIDPRWYETQKDARGVVDHVQRDGDVLVYWNGDTETNVHPPTRLTLVKPAPEGHVYTGSRAKEGGAPGSGETFRADEDVIPLEISKLENVHGPLKKPERKRVLAVINDPNQATWSDAASLIIGPRNTTMWQAVRHVEPTFPAVRGHDGTWPQIPTRDSLLKAVHYAATLPKRGTREDGYVREGSKKQSAEAGKHCAAAGMAHEAIVDDESEPSLDRTPVTIHDDDAILYTQHWWSGMGDPLYAIGSNDGIDIPRFIVEQAVRNLDSDLRRVKPLGHGKYQLGRGTFDKADIDELRTMRDSFQAALGSSEASEAAEESRKKKAKSKQEHGDAAPMDGHCAVVVENGDGTAKVQRSPECTPTGRKIETPRDVWDLLHARYATLGHEIFEIILVSNQGEMMGSPITIATGQADRVTVDIEQIVGPIVGRVQDGAAAGAKGYVVAHCHPSSGHYARPSAADKRLTEDIRKAAEVGAPSTAFIDHVVICPVNKAGDGEYYSFSEGKATKVAAPN